MKTKSPLRLALALGVAASALSGCVHTVKLEPSDKPFKIELNITQEVRIKVDKEVDELITKNPDIF